MGSARRKRLETTLRKAAAKLDDARAERDRLRTTLERLVDRIAALEARLDASVLPSDADATSARIDRLTARVVDLRAQVDVLAPEGEAAERRTGEGAQRGRDTIERIRSLERQLAAAREREDELTTELVREETIVADLQALFSEQIATPSQAKAEGRVDRPAVATEQTEAERLRQELTRAAARADAEHRAAEDAGRDLAAAVMRIAELEASESVTETNAPTNPGGSASVSVRENDVEVYAMPAPESPDEGGSAEPLEQEGADERAAAEREQIEALRAKLTRSTLTKKPGPRSDPPRWPPA